MKKLITKYLKGLAVAMAVLAPLAMFVEVYMDLMQPSLLEDIIDIGIVNQDLDFVLRTGAKMIAAALIGFAGGAACSFFASFAATDMATRLRQGLFDKVQKLSFIEIDRFQASSLITRLTNDVTQVQNMLSMVLRGAVRAPLLCAGGILMAVTQSPKLASLFFIAIPLILFATILILTKSYPLFSKVQNRIDRINTVMRESILGVRVIKALTMEESQVEKFELANDDLKMSSIRAQNMNMILWPIVTLIMNVSIVGVLWFGGNMVNKGTLEVGKIMAFVNYLFQIMNSLIMLVTMVLNFSRAKASADRINEVLETESSVQNDRSPAGMKGFDIEFQHVSFRYTDTGENVLKDISVFIKEGEKVGIIGSTGAGKSSFVNLIPRLYDATEGSITIGGTDVKMLNLCELREQIGVVLQETTLFSGTIKEAIEFGSAEADKGQMEQAAKYAQAYEFIMEKENGFDSLVEQRGKNFSGGQKQRLSIARTLIRRPKILILDDSTSALDVATEARLQDSVREFMTGSTVLMIAQRVSAMMDADKIIVLDNGRIEAVGTHLELLQKSVIYRTIAIAQLGEEVMNHG